MALTRMVGWLLAPVATNFVNSCQELDSSPEISRTRGTAAIEIALDDAISAVAKSLLTDSLSGAWYGCH